MRAIDIVIESWTEACNHLVQMERDQMTITQQIEDTNEYLEDLSRRGYLSPSKEHGLLERLTMYSNDRSHIVERYHYLWKDINRMREDWIELEYILAEMKRVDGEYGSDREELRFSRGPMPPRMPSVGRAVERAHRF
jgi:hypothetical protein